MARKINPIKDNLNKYVFVNYKMIWRLLCIFNDTFSYKIVNDNLCFSIRNNSMKDNDVTPFTLWPTSGRVVTLITGRREVPGSMSGRACRPSRSEFSVVFLRNSRKYGLGSLRKTPHGGHPAFSPRPLV